MRSGLLNESRLVTLDGTPLAPEVDSAEVFARLGQDHALNSDLVAAIDALNVFLVTLTAFVGLTTAIFSRRAISFSATCAAIFSRSDMGSACRGPNAAASRQVGVFPPRMAEKSRASSDGRASCPRGGDAS